MPSLTKKIAHNTIIQLIGKMIGTILGVAAIGIMTRYLGREGFGQYTTIIAYLQFFGLFIDFGLNVIIVQMISETEDQTRINKIISNIFTIRFFSAMIFLGLAPLFVLLFPYPYIIKMGIALTTLSFFFIVLHQILISIFQKELRMDKVALAEVLGRAALVLGISLAVFLKSGLLGIMAGIILGSFVNFLITYFFSLRYIKLCFSFDFLFWKNIISRSWPIGLSVIFNLIYMKADTLILSLFKSQEIVGIYGAPYRVLEILIMFPIMFVGIIMPLLSKSFAAGDKERFKRVLQKSFDFLIISAVPLVIGTLFLAGPIMVLVAGEEFAVSAPILKILVLAAAIIFMGYLFGSTIVAINQQRKMIWAYLTTAVVALTGYFIFIPRYSYFGAAWMTVAAEGLIAFIAFFVVCKKIKFFFSFKIFFKALSSSLIMGFALYLFKGYNLLFLIILSIFIYFSSLYFLKGFSKEMIQEIIGLKKT